MEVVPAQGAEAAYRVRDAASGLDAFIVLDDTTLGPAAGGIRTKRYASPELALADARALARAMTIKCALAGLDAGGGKAVVMDHDALSRDQAFARLGEAVEALGGHFRTAGDLGTTPSDLAAAATTTRWVQHDSATLARAVARGLVACVRAAVAAKRGGDQPALSGLRVAVQGAGAIGRAVLEALASAGALLFVADVDPARARAAAAATGAQVMSPEVIMLAEVDVLAPCATGDVIDAQLAAQLPAWAVVGAANNILTDAGAGRTLHRRGILHVPDAIASAGAVIDGIGASVMGLADRTPLIDALYETASAILAESARSGRPPAEVAESTALKRIRSSRTPD